MEHAYWGPAYPESAMQRRHRSRTVSRRGAWTTWRSRPRGCWPTATSSAGIQGRMEWGPRALGNRSILADPRRADMKDVINSKIKFREPYRPFAPSVLEEDAAATTSTSAARRRS